MKYRVFIVDDHPLLRNGLRQALDGQPALTVVGEAPSGAAAIAQSVALRPDLVVMDLHLPDLNGIEATRRILEVVPDAKILVFSGDANPTLVDAALQAGACGYILKESVLDELLRAIELAFAGKLYLSPEVSAGILNDYRRVMGGEGVSQKPTLTTRENQLLSLIADGKRNKEIATRLGLSPNSVETYRARLMKKLGCSSTAELVRYAIRIGITPP